MNCRLMATPVKVCRICLKPDKNNKFRSIFRDEKSFNVATKIFLISGVQVVECEGNPAVICNACFNEVINAYRLRKRCLKNDSFFRSKIPKEFFSRGLVEQYSADPFSNHQWLFQSDVPVKNEFDVSYDRSLPNKDPYEVSWFVDIKTEPELGENDFNNARRESFNSSADHIRTDTENPDEALFECDLCGEQFKLKKQIKSHIRYHHSPVPKHDQRKTASWPEGREKFSCLICSIDFTTKYNLRFHIVNKHADVPASFGCHLCAKKYKLKGQLSQHMRVAHRPIDYEDSVCLGCSKVFRTKRYLVAHQKYQKSVQNEKCSKFLIRQLFYCDFCGETKRSKYQMEGHIKKHFPEEEFICETCGSIHLGIGRLRSHENTHIVVDPKDFLPCPQCSRLLKNKHSLSQHIKTVHDRLREVQCPHCPHISITSSAYNKHYKVVHLKLKPFACSLCRHSFSSSSILADHVRSHTGERIHVCKFCSKTYCRSKNRKIHELKCEQLTNEQRKLN